MMQDAYPNQSWEQRLLTDEDDGDIQPVNLHESIAQIEAANEQIKEELKEEEQKNNQIFTNDFLEDNDNDINTELATMSELDEINPPDQMSFNPKFFEAARDYISEVDLQVGVGKKGRAFADQLSQSFYDVQTESKSVMSKINDLLKDMKDNKNPNHSTKFKLFADELIKATYDQATLNELLRNSSVPKVYQAIHNKFLAKSWLEAKYLLQSMAMVVKQASPDCDVDPADLVAQTQENPYFNDSRSHTQVHGISHMLLDINRTRIVDQLLTKEESAQQLFNYSVFKLACIFERVRLYTSDIVKPRDSKLKVIEVNLDTDTNKMIIDGDHLINIWEKNDFIMTYQVLQTINNELKRLEKKNIERGIFTEMLTKTIQQIKSGSGQLQNSALADASERSRKDSVTSTDTYLQPRSTPYSSEEACQVQSNRRIIQSFFLQNQQNLSQKAFQINAERWESFTKETRQRQNRSKQPRSREEVQSMRQEVFLQFNIKLNKPTNLPKGVTRTFQLELMYHQGSAISQKVRFQQSGATQTSTFSTNSEEHRFLFLQVPFKLILGTDVFMIIKVFSNTQSKSATEQQHIWTPGNDNLEGLKKMRNEMKFYEGYSLINISDAFWTKNLKCGQRFVHPAVQFYKPDKVQIVEDRFVQILREKTFDKHKVLQEQYQPVVSYTLYSSLVAHTKEINLNQMKMVMMKRFTKTLFQSRDMSASQFLKNEPGSAVRSYSNEQLYAIEKQIRQYLFNLNEIKLDLLSLHFIDGALCKQPFVRLQIFLRQKDQGCFEQVYSSFDEMLSKTYSHQTHIVPIHQNRAILRDTCFIKLPTKDQSSLGDLYIVVLVQFPILTCEQIHIKDQNGNRLSADQVRRGLSLSSGQKFDQNHIMGAPDVFYFKTEYISEIPVYDVNTQSVIQADIETKKLQFKKFSPRGFDIKSKTPLVYLQEEPRVVLFYGVDVLSMYFTHERHFNAIISLYEQDSKKDLSDDEIKMIMEQTKLIEPKIMSFHAEKLLTILVNIFCRTQSEVGSSYAFEAILFVIAFFKRQRSAKDQQVVDDFITKHLEIQQQENPIYPKLLYQLLMFTESLQNSLKAGKIVGEIAKHFTLFKEMPTIMSFLKMSYELEQTQIEVGRMNEKRKKNFLDLQRKNTMKKGNREQEAEGPPTIEITERSQVKDFIQGAKKHEATTATVSSRFSHQVESEQIEDLQKSPMNLNQSVVQLSGENMEGSNIQEESKMGNKDQTFEINGSLQEQIRSFSEVLSEAHGDLPVVNVYNETGLEHNSSHFDQLMAERDYRQGSIKEVYQKRGTEGPEILPMIDNGEVLRPEQLLFKIKMPKEEFQSVLELILNNIVKCLHSGINKSCFTLRMIFYKNLCGILEHVVTFLSQDTIWDIFQNLVKPLNLSTNDKKLGIERNADDGNNLMESQRMTMSSINKGERGAAQIITTGSALRSEQALAEERGQKQRGITNVRMRVMNYLSQENFWVAEIVGQEEVNTNEFVRRIITMGQFLESKAIEKLPNNPYLGRRISREFWHFISECSGDFSSHKKNSMFLQNISQNLKAHSLLYILHQCFKHENRFAQLFDLGQAASRGRNGDYDHQYIETIRENQIAENRAFNRQSLAVSDYQFDDEASMLIDDLNNHNKESKKKNRLYYFIKDSDYYTSLLLQIVQKQGDIELPHEITSTLEPVREKCQLIIFQLVTLLNRQTLAWFIDDKKQKQLKMLLQNMIELIISDSLEFRVPFTLYGGEKKLRVFQKFTLNLSAELERTSSSELMVYRATLRPIFSALWLIVLLIYVHRLKVINEQQTPPQSHIEYKEQTWSMFEQFTSFWRKFTITNQKKRILVQTEQIYEKQFRDKVINVMRKAVEKEAINGQFFTCHNLIELLFRYEQEYFKYKSPDKLDILTQLVLLCQTLNKYSENYKQEFKEIEDNPDFDSCLYREMWNIFEQFKDEDKRLDFIDHLNDILQKFKLIERRILLFMIAEKSNNQLYRGFCHYEQLKIFMSMNLDYVNNIFSFPMAKFRSLLKENQRQMQADDDDSADEILNLESITDGARLPSSLGKAAVSLNTYVHFKTEIAFTHVKEHELVESSCAIGRLNLGSANIELNTRINLMQEACDQLRKERFFLMAIALKEKEKQLLMQSFEYGTSEDPDDIARRTLFADDANQDGMRQAVQKFSVFNTLNAEKTIHKDILNFKKSGKHFCTYFSIKFFGEKLPVELKRKEGFILRGLASQTTFQLEDDLKALYKHVTFVQENEQLPDPNCPTMMIRLEKVRPFTVSKRKRFRISEKNRKISQTLTNNAQKYPPEFKQYFEQNFVKQFYKTNRVQNDQLLNMFQNYATSKLPHFDLLYEMEEMTKEQALSYYKEINQKSYDRSIDQEGLEKFWQSLIKKKYINQEGRIMKENMLKFVVEEWRGMTPMLQDLEIHVYEVAETFPTMFNMQAVVCNLTTRIGGVDKENINWQKRIKKQINVRQQVVQIFLKEQAPDKLNSEEAFEKYVRKVGPILRDLWDELRKDIDTDQNGGVLSTLEVFFPSLETLERLKTRAEITFRKCLNLFVTIETWFMQVQTSLLLFEEKNKLFDDYQRLNNPENKLIEDNAINWFSKFMSKRAFFEKVRKKCNIDKALKDEEEAIREADDNSDLEDIN